MCICQHACTYAGLSVRECDCVSKNFVHLPCVRDRVLLRTSVKCTVDAILVHAAGLQGLLVP